MISWGGDGIKYECDPRQVELIIVQVGQAYDNVAIDSDELMSADKKQVYQSLTARCNFTTAVIYRTLQT